MAGTTRSGGDRTVNDADCFPMDGLPSRPSTMTREESQIWNNLLSLIPVEMLRRADAYQLQVLCECLSRKEKYEEILRAEPDDYKAHRAYMQLVSHISRLSAQFGLSPVDRRRIKLGASQTDDLEDFLSE